jgi:hypothetical protein
MAPTSAPLAERAAEPGLFAGLVDDAAVFPPGNAPLPEAMRLHRVHTSSRYAACVGPLLVPASAVGELLSLLADEPFAVAVIGRPGTPASDVWDAVATLQHNGIHVAGAELGWEPGWREARPADVPLSLEVPRGPEQPAALDDLARDASDSSDVRAKFRTGATPSWAWPDERELAEFVRAAIDRDLGFKLTGGLHHALRSTHPDDSLQPEHHGLLNVLTAVRWALNGEEVDELVPLLAERDPAPLVAHVTRMSAADAAIVRAFFTAYGCCTVTDPIDELTRLGLIEGA